MKNMRKIFRRPLPGSATVTDSDGAVVVNPDAEQSEALQQVYSVIVRVQHILPLDIDASRPSVYA